MNGNKNFMLAVVLSALVLLGWSVLSDRMFPTAGPQTQKVQDGKVRAKAEADAPTATAEKKAVLRPVNAVLSGGRRVRIETPRIAGSINLVGAKFDDLVLVEQRQSIAKDSPPVRLLSPQGAKGAYFAQFGWSGQSVATPGPDTVWNASAPVLKRGQPVTLSWTNPTGQTFQLTVSVDEGYLFTVDRKVANRGGGAVALTPYGLVSRAEKSADHSTWTNHVGPIAFLSGKADYDIDWKTLDENRAGVTRDTHGGWLGFTDKYWLTALVPADGAPAAASFKKSPTGAYQADFASNPIVVEPGKQVSSTARLFAGAKEKEWLDRYEDAGITKLSKSIDWGWFEFFMRPIFWLLRELFHLTGNFGVAIICLTLIVRAIMFPIADKGFRSMAGMRRIQPKMKAIQEKYKEDKPRLQQEMLKIYSEEKINPAGGCLPILLQIPVFYALYKVLMVSVEMRHQPFALWIKDLSAPDPMTPVNLFGLLHFTPPAMLAVGMLPILMGFTMWLQFKLNPAQVDPVQQQVFSFMPWVMMVIMAPYAAGLLLYWTVSNILSIGQQWWLYKRYDLASPPTVVEAKATRAK